MTESSAVVEKSLRSVFVGNIPYEATEETLRDIFSQAGPVASFKLMYDRESGKPKGYGFCEYKDQETALSAMRNLNGYEIAGRPLRVDNACTEKSRMEMQSLMMGPVTESPYGTDVDPDKAPEAISNAVASLPPEQMYELMRQMKLCVRNNSQEARTMLMNNPQLAYALLQAQVVMRIIDPKIAVQILHGSRDPVEPIFPSSVDLNEENAIKKGAPPPPVPAVNGGPPPMMPSGPFPPNSERPPAPIGMAPGPGMMQGGPPGQPMMQGGPPPIFPVQPPAGPVPPPNRPSFQGGADHDHRQMGGASRGPPNGPKGPFPPSNDQDMRSVPSGPPGPGAPPHGHDNFRPPHDNNRFGRDFDQRDNRFRDGPPNAGPPRDRDGREPYPRDNREMRGSRDPRAGGGGGPDRDADYRSKQGPDGPPRDPRARGYTQNQDEDFRHSGPNNAMGNAPPPQGMNRPPPNAPQNNAPPGLDRQDQEKANLIMQVLQLSDEQIRMLPPEQQTSILQLKEQIQRSSH